MSFSIHRGERLCACQRHSPFLWDSACARCAMNSRIMHSVVRHGRTPRLFAFTRHFLRFCVNTLTLLSISMRGDHRHGPLPLGHGPASRWMLAWTRTLPAAALRRLLFLRDGAPCACCVHCVHFTMRGCTFAGGVFLFSGMRISCIVCFVLMLSN